ncbi:suppressor of Triplolethal [Tachypleus tridentatus]|uniref:suppressor of Triplolethal n=1 Tax=Tachypleus tridentatus TaxID=6853 RepID=UPI003FD27AD2
MATLVEGQQYGLSSQGNIFNNKSLIFVKLTDSALRSIEDYLKSRDYTPNQPTIQFEDNKGVIQLPGSHNTEQNFGFTLASVKADSPQGSFECLQQKGSRLMDSLGSMMYKMHICANEDSYQNTRVKMTVAEQENKKNCTKVIKESGPYVGRKVKMKTSLASIPPPKPSNHVSYSALSTSKSAPKLLSMSGSSHLNQAGSSSHAKATVYQKSLNPDILKRTYRERVIHLLALRPYKKPELLARLMRDGIKEKDKKGLSAILSQVAVLRDNTFHLARHVWNDVCDDWPFYSAEELKQMKRQKPQNLTPPSESENRSPYVPQEYVSNVAQKRAFSNTEPRQTKKQRISHYNKSDQPGINSHGSIPLGSRSNLVNQNCYKTDLTIPDTHQRLGHSNADSFLENGLLDSNSRPSCTSGENLNVDPTSVNISKSDIQLGLKEKDKGTKMDKHPVFHSQKPVMSCSDRSPVSYNENFSLDTCSQNHSPNEKSWQKMPRFKQLCMSNVPPVNNSKQNSSSVNSSRINNVEPKFYNSGYSNHNKHHNFPNEKFNNKKSKTSSTSCGSLSGESSPASSPDSQFSIESSGSCFSSGGPEADYLRKYIVISNNEQRARYKSDFIAEYEEYLRLHGLLVDVSKKFATLECSLRQFDEGSEDWEQIMHQIKAEYRENRRKQYHLTKKRFQYLHNKLSHIKQLVVDYDQTQC